MSKYLLEVSIRGNDLRYEGSSTAYPQTSYIRMYHDQGSTNLSVSSNGPADGQVRVKQSTFFDDDNPWGSETQVSGYITFEPLSISVNSIERGAANE